MLLYRFPGKQIQRKSGRFVACKSTELDGFVLSSFSGGKYWRFIEDDSSDILYSESLIPLVQTKEQYILKADQLINAIRSLGLKKWYYREFPQIHLTLIIQRNFFVC